MSSAIKVVKRKDRGMVASSCNADALSVAHSSKSEIVQTVKTWINEARERRQAETQLALQLMRGPKFRES